MQSSIDNAVVAFYAHVREAFPVILKAIIDAVKNDQDPGAVARKAIETILEVAKDDVDEGVLTCLEILKADGAIEAVVEVVLSERATGKLSGWVKKLLKGCCLHV